MKTALITGASGGIGLATTHLFLEHGYRVLAHYNSSQNQLPLESDTLIHLESNFANNMNPDYFFRWAIKHFGIIDVLVNSAGTHCLNYDYVMDMNLRVPFILSKIAMTHMKEHGAGSIINISSIGVKYGGNPEFVVYTMSKAALEAMTICLAKEGAPNVRVNAIRAGITNTNFKFHDEKRIYMVPMKRMADPKEIAEAIYFLASDKASYITGSILTVAGGE